MRAAAATVRIGTVHVHTSELTIQVEPVEDHASLLQWGEEERRRSELELT